MPKDSHFIKIKLPQNFMHPLYFEADVISLPRDISEYDAWSIPFYYDLLFANDFPYKSAYPWENPAANIELIYEKWEGQQPIISEYFKIRNKEKALKPMKESLALFMDALFWGNGKPVKNLLNWESGVEGLVIKPVNVVERLSYIFHSPNHYHSFIQLQQLFDEFQKKFKIALIK